MWQRIRGAIVDAILLIAIIGGYYMGRQMLKEYLRQNNHDFNMRIQALERADR